eukprot:gene10454-21814_t
MLSNAASVMTAYDHKLNGFKLHTSLVEMIRHLFCIIFSLKLSITYGWATRTNAPLSTFRTDALNIKSPCGCNSTFEEAFWIVKSYFMHNNRYSEKDWLELKEQYSYYSDKNAAISDFLDRFGDPYTRFIPEKAMTARQRSIRGEMIGVGLNLRRRIYFIDMSENIRHRIINFIKIFSLQATRARFRHFHTIYRQKQKVQQRQSEDYKIVNTIGVPSIKRLTMNILTNIINIIRNRRNKEYKMNEKHPNKSCTLTINSTSNSTYGTTSTTITDIQPAHLRDKLFLAAEITGPLLSAYLICTYLSDSFIFWSHWKPTVALISFILSGRNIIERFAPIVVSEVYCGSPSSAAGVCVGDKIVAVDGRHVWRLSAKRLRSILDEGPLGECIRLSLRRKITTANSIANTKPGLNSDVVPSSPHHNISSSIKTNNNNNNNNMNSNLNILNKSIQFNINVVRDWMPIQVIHNKILSNGLGYISINEFTDKTAHEVYSSMQELHTKMFLEYGKHMHALVLDLRGNPGGPLNSALEVAALFLNKRKPILQMVHLGKIESHYSLNVHADLTTELLVLVDGRTASASEILVAALRDHERATTMGSTTVGKDVAQALMVLSDGSGLTCSVRSYLSPFGRSLSGGIPPDYPVTPSCIIPDQLRWNQSERSWKFIE